MALSDRDIEILAFLQRMRYGFVSQIKRRWFADLSKKACEKAMRKLVKFGLVGHRHVPRNWRRPVGNIWYLKRQGAELLSELWGTEVSFRPVSGGLTVVSQAYHRLRMVDFRMAMEEGLGGLPISVTEELVDDCKVKRKGRLVSPTALFDQTDTIAIIPDLIYVFHSHVTGQERVYMVEIDTGSETLGGKSCIPGQNTLLAKLMAYEKLLCDPQGSWQRFIVTKASVFEILFVTESDLRIRHFSEQTQGHLQHPGYVLLTTHERLLNEGLFGEMSWVSLAEPRHPRLLLKSVP